MSRGILPEGENRICNLHAAARDTPAMTAAQTCPRPRNNLRRGYHPARKLASLFGKSDANLHAEHSLPAGSMRVVGIGARLYKRGGVVGARRG